MTDLFRYPHIVIILIAYILSDVAVAALIRLANAWGAVDRPGVADYKTQKRPVPFLGGFGLFIGLFVTLLTTLNWKALSERGVESFLASANTKIAIAIAVGGAATAILGLVDDFRPINALIKLAILAAVTGVLVSLGLQVDLPVWGPVQYILTLLWVVGVISAFNAIDNTDGVAGVSATSAAGWTFLVAWGSSAATSQQPLSFLAVALAGATIGFLRHNRPDAKVYLGNSGSFALGFMVSVLAISGTWTTSPLRSSIAPLLLLAYPLFDISYTIFMRWRRGIVRNLVEAVVVSGRDHTAHRLQALGLNKWQTLAVIALLNGLGGAAALAIVRYDLPDGWALLLAAAVLLTYLAFGWGIRDAVNLRSPEARISHRRPTGQIPKK